MRIAAFDIETLPGSALVWRTGQQFVALDQIERPSRMTCFAARFNDQRRTEFYSEWEHGHEEMVRQAHRIVDEADAVLHFNGKTFDVPWFRTEWAQAGLTPPSPFKQIDLYQQTKQFALMSHKLQAVSTHLAKIEGKLETGGLALWRGVLAGDPKAQARMRRYNIRDVDLLWELHDELLPWLKLPNANLYGNGTRVCPRCAKDGALQFRGYERLAAGVYRRVWCDPGKGGCGGWSRGTQRVSGTELVEVAS